MDVRKDFLPRLITQKSKDETLSYSGKPDFALDEPEIQTISPRNQTLRPRTKRSELNSYT